MEPQNGAMENSQVYGSAIPPVVRSARERLARQRVALVRITELVAEIRLNLRARLDNSSLKLSDVSRATHMTPGLLGNFLSGVIAICGGRRFSGLVQLLDMNEQGEEILRLSEGMSERMVSVSSFGPEVVALFFDLMDAFVLAGDKVTMDTFAEVFGPDVELVVGVLKMSHTALDHIKDKHVRDRIEGVLLEPEFNLRVQEQREKRSAVNVQKLRELINELNKRFGMFKITAQKLEVSESTLRNALRGGSSAETYVIIFAKAEEVLASPADDAAGSDESLVASAAAVSPSPAVQGGPLAESFDSADRLFDAVGGKTSPSGAKWVLGPDVMRELKIHLAGEMVAPLCRHIEIVRAMLNMLAQCDNDDLKKRAMESVGPELEELQLAMQLFSAKYPNQLTALHEERRLQWAALSPGNSGGRAPVKRQPK